MPFLIAPLSRVPQQLTRWGMPAALAHFISHPKHPTNTPPHPPKPFYATPHYGKKGYYCMAMVFYGPRSFNPTPVLSALTPAGCIHNLLPPPPTIPHTHLW